MFCTTSSQLECTEFTGITAKQRYLIRKTQKVIDKIDELYFTWPTAYHCQLLKWNIVYFKWRFFNASRLQIDNYKSANTEQSFRENWIRSRTYVNGICKPFGRGFVNMKRKTVFPFILVIWQKHCCGWGQIHLIDECDTCCCFGRLKVPGVDQPRLDYCQLCLIVLYVQVTFRSYHPYTQRESLVSFCGVSKCVYQNSRIYWIWWLSYSSW